MKKLIKEEINYKVGKNANGKSIVYIVADASENLDNFGKILRKYKAKNDGEKWYWELYNDDKKNQLLLYRYINPAIEELTAVETPSNGTRRNSSELKMTVDGINRELENFLNAPGDEFNAESATVEEVRERVASFKEKLVNITNSEEFMKVFGPVITLRKAIGHQYSFFNTILIWLQDPQATLVKPKSRWIKLNRYVLPNAPAIILSVPRNMKKFNPEDRQLIKTTFLAQKGCKSVKELTPGDKEELDILLKGYGPEGFKYAADFYDHRFTKPKRGKKDLAPSASTENVDWFDDKSPVEEKTEKLYATTVEVIKDMDIQIQYVKDLNGARGSSSGGLIKVLKDVPKNIGAVKTLFHELAHEILHHKYASSKNAELAGFFVGRKQGRAMVEQQAEVSAWIICQYFGFNMQTSTNYMGCWGMDSKNAVSVFDTVAEVSNYIIDKILNKMGRKVNESKNIKETKQYFTGKYIANKLGLGYFYEEGEEMLNNKTTKTIGENKLREMVREAITNIISEGYETVQWRHFNNNREDEEMIKDAIEALEMSDGAIDFFEWYGAYQDEVEPDYAEMLWKKALKKYESMF